MKFKFRREIHIPVILFILGITLISFRQEIAKLLVEIQKIRGLVVYKEIDKKGATWISVVTNEKQKKTYMIPDDSLAKAISIGDYIIKERGSVYYKLATKSDTLIFKSYP